MSSGFNASKTITFARESKALLIVKLGFSVVAHISVINPLSTKGRRESCCALFRRCISSKNRRVFFQYALFFSACSSIVFRSSFLLFTQDSSKKSACSWWESTLAIVVFQHHGDHQKIIEGTCQFSRNFCIDALVCSCQTTSSNVVGRR